MSVTVPQCRFLFFPLGLSHPRSLSGLLWLLWWWQLGLLELLKLRFGEHRLHVCEVMVRDLDHSKRVDTAIHNTVGTDKHHRCLHDHQHDNENVQAHGNRPTEPRIVLTGGANPAPGAGKGECKKSRAKGAADTPLGLDALHAMIISKEYWPALQDEDFQVCGGCNQSINQSINLIRLSSHPPLFTSLGASAGGGPDD